MAKRSGFLRFGAFLYPTGHHIAAWRHPDTVPGAGLNIRHYRELAQIAEAARFDLLFLADGVGTRGDRPEVLSRTAHSYVSQFEPLTLLASLSAVTERIGLVGTASTSFNEPFHIARKFASLDHLSGGRSGWNLVTSSSEFEARNFNLEHHLAHADRYERASEFADVVQGLWNSWDADAFVWDKAGGRVFDPAHRHVLNHKGKHFSVQGPLNVARSPQGRPVLVQAGSSEAGKALAARTAEVVFTAQQTLQDAVDFYADLKGRMAAHGRDPASLLVMPGVFPVVGSSESEAREKFEQLQSLIDPVLGLSLISGLTGGVDLSGYDQGPVNPDFAGCVGGPKGLAQGANRSWVGDPARIGNAAIGLLGSNPKGSRLAKRHSALRVLPRRPVWAATRALIGAWPAGFAPVKSGLTGPCPQL